MHSALKYLSENHFKGILQLTEIIEGKKGPETIFDVLREKHPPTREVSAEALVTTEDETLEVHPGLFESLTGSAI